MCKKGYRCRLITGLLLAFFLACIIVIMFLGKLSLAAEVSQKTPKLLVKPAEVYLTKMHMEKDITSPSGYRFYAKIKNTSGQLVKKVVYTYKVTYTMKGDASQYIPDSVQTETETLIAKDIEAKSVSEEVSCIGNQSGTVESMEFETEQVYAGDAVSTYYSATESYETDWATPDTEAPVISGLSGKTSACSGDPYLTVYSDKKKGFNYKKFITVNDDRDLKVTVKADTSHLNFEKGGKGKVYLTATDSAGNSSKKWVWVMVIASGDLEDYCDSILKKITKNDWSQLKKARAIYKYVRSHISYSDRDKHVNWKKEALEVIMFQAGDCFSYYSLARALLTRVGIPNIMIRRYPHVNNYDHFWNLVFIKGGWYHFDTTPRRRGGNFCLVTDSQLTGYDSGSMFKFNKKIYPKRATKKISPDPKKTK